MAVWSRRAIDFEAPPIGIIRRLCLHFRAVVRFRGGALAPRTAGAAGGSNRMTEDHKMADQLDDLSIPMKPARGKAAVATSADLAEPPRPAAAQPAKPAPPRTSDLLRSPTEPARAPASSQSADPHRPNAQPAQIPAMPRTIAETRPGSTVNGIEARTLIAGPEISFTGDLSACDRLIIEGIVEANLQRCEHMIIGESGIFRGHGSTENADVRGRIEGELIVRKRLLIRAGGHVSGSISYGDIEIEPGGRISGTIDVIAIHGG
jgi:cytoskeletal protein CcmA (bactofilin family)